HHVLEARVARTAALLWTFTGDGGLQSAPLVVKDPSGVHVYVGSKSGMLYALNLRDGSVAWSTNVGSPIPAPNEGAVAAPLPGLGAGDGLLVVPAGNLLLAYGR